MAQIDPCKELNVGTKIIADEGLKFIRGVKGQLKTFVMFYLNTLVVTYITSS